MKNKKIIAGGICAVIIAATAGGFYLKSNTTKTENTPSVENNANVDGNVATEKDGSQNFKIGLSSFEPTANDLTAMTNDIEKVQKYYTDKVISDGLLSEYGMLYSLAKNNIVSYSDVAASGYVASSDEVVKNTDVLLINSADFNSVIGAEGGDNKLVVFTALNTKNGYYLSGVGVESKMLTAEQFGKLIQKYSFAHGSITNPKKGEDNYNVIMTAIGITGGNYDVKHIACDNKYAVVVVGSLDNPAEIKEYALMREGNGWKVIFDDLAVVANAKQYVNEQYPDFELGLLPLYNIKDYGQIVTGLDEYVDSLISLGMLTKEDMSKGAYECGAGNFAFIQTNASNKRLIGHVNSENKLEFFEADSLNDAIATMLDKEKFPPVFILKFDN